MRTFDLHDTRAMGSHLIGDNSPLSTLPSSSASRVGRAASRSLSYMDQDERNPLGLMMPSRITHRNPLGAGLEPAPELAAWRRVALKQVCACLGLPPHQLEEAELILEQRDGWLAEACDSPALLKALFLLTPEQKTRGFVASLGSHLLEVLIRQLIASKDWSQIDRILSTLAEPEEAHTLLIHAPFPLCDASVPVLWRHGLLAAVLHPWTQQEQLPEGASLQLDRWEALRMGAMSAASLECCFRAQPDLQLDVVTSIRGDTLLALCLENQYDDLIVRYAQRMAQPEHTLAKHLDRALSTQRPRDARLLYMLGAPISKGLSYKVLQMYTAIETGSVALVAALLEAGCPMEGAEERADGPLQLYSCLCLAAQRGNGELCSLLLEAGADPSFALPGGHTLLTLALEGGHCECVRTLLAHPKNPLGSHTARSFPVALWSSPSALCPAEAKWSLWHAFLDAEQVRGGGPIEVTCPVSGRFLLTAITPYLLGREDWATQLALLPPTAFSELGRHQATLALCQALQTQQSIERQDPSVFAQLIRAILPNQPVSVEQIFGTGNVEDSPWDILLSLETLTAWEEWSGYGLPMYCNTSSALARAIQRDCWETARLIVRLAPPPTPHDADAILEGLLRTIVDAPLHKMGAARQRIQREGPAVLHELLPFCGEMGGRMGPDSRLLLIWHSLPDDQRVEWLPTLVGHPDACLANELGESLLTEVLLDFVPKRGCEQSVLESLGRQPQVWEKGCPDHALNLMQQLILVAAIKQPLTRQQKQLLKALTMLWKKETTPEEASRTLHQIIRGRTAASWAAATAAGWKEDLVRGLNTRSKEESPG